MPGQHPAPPPPRALESALGLYQAGRREEADALCRAVPETSPDFAATLYLRGVIARDRKDGAGAIALIREAIARDPANPLFPSTLGAIQEETGDGEAAVVSYFRALELGRRPASLVLSLGRLLRRQGRNGEAAEVLAGADSAEGLRELGDARRALGDPEGALAAYDGALALAPGDPTTHGHRALVRLLLGDLEAGFAEYEWRLKDPAYRSTPLPGGTSLWRGEPLAGRTLRLVAEQGFGDTFMFLRYASLVAERGARVTVLCQKKLVELAATVPGVAAVQALGEAPLPADFQVPMASLPHRFGTRRDSIPAPIPYIHPPADRIDEWRRRLGPLPGLKVGLVWRGASSGTRLAAKGEALAPEHLASLARLPGLSVFSLQKDPEPAELAAIGGIPHLEEAVATFTETAAAMAACDLLVSVDTAAVHLAGAIGLPCRALLVPVHDWRWMREGNDSPWYPGLRLHRRAAGEDWETVVAGLRGELDSLTG